MIALYTGPLLLINSFDKFFETGQFEEKTNSVHWCFDFLCCDTHEITVKRVKFGNPQIPAPVKFLSHMVWHPWVGIPNQEPMANSHTYFRKICEISK